jgi:hypothetical protein
LQCKKIAKILQNITQPLLHFLRINEYFVKFKSNLSSILKKIDAFSAESEMLSALKASIFQALFSALKVKWF